jgi:hypothetical protein
VYHHDWPNITFDIFFLKQDSVLTAMLIVM